MKTFPKLLIFLFLVFLFYSTYLFAADPAVSLNKGSFNSATTCGKCHQMIFKDWKGSMHAGAISDPIFHAVFIEARNEGGEEAARLCLACHSPTTVSTKDFKLEQEISREGVTCDFCHSIRNVNLEQKNPFEIDTTSGTKYGPFKNVTSPVHPTSYSENHEKSELCAGCHEFTNKHGVSILTTYSEWKNSPYGKEGKTCQHCHMGQRKGLVVSGEVENKEKYINSHAARGGHSITQLRKAIELEIGDVSNIGEKVKVVVKMKNVGSGHKVPTGIPSRRLVLTFQAKDSTGVLYEGKRVYQKVVADKDGNPIERDDHLFTKGASILKDNRLTPQETREEYFSFLVPKNREYILSASISYLYEPLLLQRTEMSIELSRSEKVVEIK